MPKTNLTDAFCKGSKSVTGELVEWADTKERGLALRVTAAGAKSWTFRYRNAAGQQKRISLGRLDDVSLFDARAAAVAQRGDLHGGIDPATARKQKKAEAVAASKLETVEEIGKRYFAEARTGRHRPNAKRPMRAATIKSGRTYFDDHVVPAFGKDRLKDLTRAQIQVFINDVADKHAPGTARQCRVVLQGIFTFAAWQEIVSANPCQFVTAPSFAARETVLTDEELRALWNGFQCVAGLEDVFVSRPLSLAILIAMTTLQRRAEVTGMRKVEVDLGAKLWTIPGSRTKNHRTHVVPLSDLAVALIKEALKLSGKGPMLFPARGDPEKSITPSSLSHAYRRLTAALKLKGTRPHDLRRTGATALTSERIGLPRFVVSQVLNHTSDTGNSAAVTAVYDRNAYLPEKRRALDAWADLLLEIVEGKERPDNVVRMAS